MNSKTSDWNGNKRLLYANYLDQAEFQTINSSVMNDDWEEMLEETVTNLNIDPPPAISKVNILFLNLIGNISSDGGIKAR